MRDYFYLASAANVLAIVIITHPLERPGHFVSQKKPVPWRPETEVQVHGRVVNSSEFSL